MVARHRGALPMIDLAMLAPVLWDGLESAVRWLHVITAIAWIGSSFYFIALDLGLRKSPGLPKGVHGEEWQVHGGGFYHIQKYNVAPDHLPEHLTWFKWEAYWTWISGMALLVLVYYLGAEIYLIDRAVLDVPVWAAILISLASIALGWIVYDRLCKSPVGQDDTRLMLVLFAVVVAMAWLYTQLFTGRAALLHLGAFTATIMSANVAMLIIPNQRKVVATLKAGGTPDPEYGRVAKQRSTHNNYLTLPVLFLMLSIHYPLVFATPYNWVIACLIFLTGVTIRHYFNSLSAGKGHVWWTWPATLALFLGVVWLSAVPATPSAEPAAASAEEERRMAAAGFADVHNTVLGRCSMCHAAEPFWPGIAAAPKGVVLETEVETARWAREIYLQAGRSHAMPPANLTWMEPAERRLIVDWYETTERGG
jgi:uncharacterized membrane protein